jgi:hypothetical protein
MSSNLAARLNKAITEEGAKLRAISESSAAARSSGGEGWSRKQELGHLIDSVTNNRVRIVVAALEGRYTGPSYDGEGWVKLGGYDAMSWNNLLELWQSANLALGAAIERIPAEKLSSSCRVGQGNAVSLEALIDDYILHMQHHLDHILDRERLTAYPSAAAAG